MQSGLLQRWRRRLTRRQTRQAEELFMQIMNDPPATGSEYIPHYYETLLKDTLYPHLVKKKEG